MILKYMKDDTWGFIDNVRQAAHKYLDIDELADRYDKEQAGGDPDLVICYPDGKPLPADIAKVNKAFTVACFDLPDEGVNRHAENLIDENLIKDASSVTAILVYLEECKEYDAILFVTNQPAYLMNDKGQTIERLS
jgi:hypothetical protein